MKKINNYHLSLLLMIVFILNTILFQSIKITQGQQFKPPTRLPGEGAGASIVTSPLSASLDLGGFDIIGDGNINANGTICSSGGCIGDTSFVMEGIIEVTGNDNYFNISSKGTENPQLQLHTAARWHYIESDILPLVDNYYNQWQEAGYQGDREVINDETATEGKAVKFSTGIRYGPYSTLPRGNYKYITRLKYSGNLVDDNGSYLNPNMIVAKLSIFDQGGDSPQDGDPVYKELDIRVVDFEEFNQWQIFSLPFSITSDDATAVETYLRAQSVAGIGAEITEDYIAIVPDDEGQTKRVHNLYVENTLRINGQMVLGSGEDYISIGDLLSGDGTRALRLRAGDADRLFIDMNGNIGIGTPNPGKKLHIYDITEGNDNAEINLQSIDGDANHWGIYHDRGTEQLRFWHEKTETEVALDHPVEENRLTMTTDGKIGIGTTDPSSKLDIKLTSGAGPAFHIQGEGTDGDQIFLRIDDLGGKVFTISDGNTGNFYGGAVLQGYRRSNNPGIYMIGNQVLPDGGGGEGTGEGTIDFRSYTYSDNTFQTLTTANPNHPSFKFKSNGNDLVTITSAGNLKTKGIYSDHKSGYISAGTEEQPTIVDEVISFPEVGQAYLLTVKMWGASVHILKTYIVHTAPINVNLGFEELISSSYDAGNIELATEDGRGHFLLNMEEEGGSGDGTNNYELWSLNRLRIKYINDYPDYPQQSWSWSYTKINF